MMRASHILDVMGCHDLKILVRLIVFAEFWSSLVNINRRNDGREPLIRFLKSALPLLLTMVMPIAHRNS